MPRKATNRHARCTASYHCSEELSGVRIFYDDLDRENFIERFGIVLTESRYPLFCLGLDSQSYFHLLLKTGTFADGHGDAIGLLTGYAVSFNRRHRRHGQYVSKSLQIHFMPGRCVI